MGVPCRTVLVVEDHELVARTLRYALEADDRFQVAGVVGAADDAVAAARATRPDVVLMDVGLPGTPGSSAVADIRAASPTSTVVLMSGVIPDSVHTAAADGFLAKGGADMVGELADLLAELDTPP